MNVYLIEIAWFVDANTEESDDFIVMADSIAEALAHCFKKTKKTILGVGSFHVHGPYKLTKAEPAVIYRY